MSSNSLKPVLRTSPAARGSGASKSSAILIFPFNAPSLRCHPAALNGTILAIGLLAFANHDLLAFRNPVDQAGQMGLRFVHVDLFHGFRLVSN